jgi:hypothetical protein
VFAEIKALVNADASGIRDNWVAIAINLAWEVIKAEQEKKAAAEPTPVPPPLPEPPPEAPPIEG